MKPIFMDRPKATDRQEHPRRSPTDKWKLPIHLQSGFKLPKKMGIITPKEAGLVADGNHHTR
jgi:hypothetical protein